MISRRKLNKLKQAAARILIAAAAMGTAGVVVPALANTQTAEVRSLVAEQPKVPTKVLKQLDLLGRPGIHTFRQRPLSGLEIRAVRIAGHAFPTNRMGRSKYVPGPLASSKAARNRA